jgi:hypothetical protein
MEFFVLSDSIKPIVLMLPRAGVRGNVFATVVTSAPFMISLMSQNQQYYWM